MQWRVPKATEDLVFGYFQYIYNGFSKLSKRYLTCLQNCNKYFHYTLWLSSSVVAFYVCAEHKICNKSRDGCLASLASASPAETTTKRRTRRCTHWQEKLLSAYKTVDSDRDSAASDLGVALSPSFHCLPQYPSIPLPFCQLCLLLLMLLMFLSLWHFKVFPADSCCCCFYCTFNHPPSPTNVLPPLPT